MQVKAITFDLWDTVIRDDSDEAKRAARGLPSKREARREALPCALRVGDRRRERGLRPCLRHDGVRVQSCLAPAARHLDGGRTGASARPRLPLPATGGRSRHPDPKAGGDGSRDPAGPGRGNRGRHSGACGPLPALGGVRRDLLTGALPAPMARNARTARRFPRLRVLRRGGILQAAPVHVCPRRGGARRGDRRDAAHRGP